MYYSSLSLLNWLSFFGSLLKSKILKGGEHLSEVYKKSIEEVLEELETNKEKGLTSDEVKSRQEEYGLNELEEHEAKSWMEILFDNLNNIIVYLLGAAAILSIFMGEYIEAIAIFLAILISVVTGFIVEMRAAQSVEALQDMVQTTVNVLRDGEMEEIDSNQLVPGDIIKLEEGDAISADGRVIESNNFAAIESALTGESEAVDKESETVFEEEVAIGDRENMVYSGTASTRGDALVVVTGTGMETEVGNVSKMLEGEKEDGTPLDREISRLGKVLIVIAVVAAVAVIIVGFMTGQELQGLIQMAIILAVAAIPEALPAVQTITLARGMETMANHEALVKTLPAVETLGSTSIIATDKTGTLTENQMLVSKVILKDDVTYDITGEGYQPEGTISKDKEEISIPELEEVSDLEEVEEHQALLRLIINGLLSSNAELAEEDNDEFSVDGDPTDGALTVLASKIGLNVEKLNELGWERKDEFPFDSDKKYMGIIADGDTPKLILKGAPDVMVEMANLKDDDAKYWENANEELAQQGMRVITLAEVELEDGEQEIEEVIENLEFFSILGMYGIIDPPRQDVKDSIALTQGAGINVKMITGDHPDTAKVIAEQIGLNYADKVMTGQDIDEMADEENFGEQLKETGVFARVSPENKLQIVEALREHKEIVAMTGDGVNDAPALNGADIGIAMGIRGTEVAKESSDMILTNDRFGTIVEAVRVGRVIFDNIKKFVSFLFTCNLVEITAIFLTVVFLLPLPVAPLHILYLNLIIDLLPAITLSFEPGEADIMVRTPRNPEKGLINKSFLFQIGLSGLVIGVSAFLVFWYFNGTDVSNTYAQTATFSAMALGQLGHVFNVRHPKTFGLDKTILENKPLMGALVISILLLLIAVYVPFMQNIMNTEGLRLVTWGILVGVTVVVTFINYLIKKAIQRFSKES